MIKKEIIMTPQERMIEYHLKQRDIHDDDVIRAMSDVDRRLFVPKELEDQAYDDGPLPIGRNQTISQPYIVAYMVQALNLGKDDIVLEIGTGCGYNAAIMSRLVSHVYSIEIIEWLGKMAVENLEKAGITNVTTRISDGYLGWEEEAPFDKIILTAAAPQIPEPLKRQLKVGGRILAPVADTYQKLILLHKTGEDEFSKDELLYVRFVPMTGKSQG